MLLFLIHQKNNKQIQPAFALIFFYIYSCKIITFHILIQRQPKYKENTMNIYL